MMEFLSDGPLWLLFPFLTVVVFLRAQGTYWLGRWATSLAVRRITPAEGWRTRLLAWLEGDVTDQGVVAIHRWGVAVIPFSFLTVGFQTMVNAGAGILRMPWWRYTLAMLPGCLAWATIYSTIGFAMWGAALAAAAGSPWGIAGMVATVIIAVATIGVRRRRRTATRAQLTVIDGEARAA